MSVAKKMRVSGSREKSREIISGSSLYFFGQVVPALAITDLRPHLPAERLRFLLDTRLQVLDAVGDAPPVLIREVVAPEVLAERVEVGGEGAPQAPIAGTEARDVSGVYSIPVFVLDRVVVQERQGIPNVLLVELYDLQLGQQQLRERNRHRFQSQPLAEADLVAHLEGADEDVHLPAVLLVEEEEALAAVERVETNLGRVAQTLEEPLRLPRGAPGHDPVQVGVVALERRVEAVLRPQLDRHPPEKPENEVLPIRLLGDAQGLLGHVGTDVAHPFTAASHLHQPPHFRAGTGSTPLRRGSPVCKDGGARSLSSSRPGCEALRAPEPAARASGGSGRELARKFRVLLEWRL